MEFIIRINKDNPKIVWIPKQFQEQMKKGVYKVKLEKIKLVD